MIYEVTINNKRYEVEVEKGQASIVKTKEVSVPVSLPHVLPNSGSGAAPAVVSVAKASPAAINAGGESIKAPMPGTILDIKISAGSKVKKGDVIFILEAMKMENEIVSPSDGTVVQIQAAKGSLVNTGDILAVIQQ